MGDETTTTKDERIAVPPCATCGEDRDRYPLVWLRVGWPASGGGNAFHAQYGCYACEARGPLGAGPSPDAALLDALTRAQANAERHRAWIAEGRPMVPVPLGLGEQD